MSFLYVSNKEELQMKQAVLPIRVNELKRSEIRNYLDLDGTWFFTLDENNQGESAGYQNGTTDFGDTILVPGCLEAQGKGLVYGELTQPAWSGTCDHPYMGVSWYCRRFQIPAEMTGKKLMLNFGGVNTDCKIWLNGSFIYEHHYGSISFGIEVTDEVILQGENVLVVQVDNTYKYEDTNVTRWEPQTHGFGSSTLEMHWSGIYRSVELVALEDSHLVDIFLKPNAREQEITVKYELNSDCAEAELYVYPEKGGKEYRQRYPLSTTTGELVLALPDAVLWSDEEPELYYCTVTVFAGGQAVDSITERFGLRDISFDGQHILLNDIPVYLRGDMVHFHWPDTISPCTDRAVLKEKLMVYKDYGLNYLRHHTFCAHPEYLDVCDEVGLLCQNELGVISLTFYLSEAYASEMWKASIKTGRNHPALICWSLGNEAYHFSDYTTGDIPSDEQMAVYQPMTFELDDTRLLLNDNPGFFCFPDDRPKVKAPIHHELRRAGASYADVNAKKHYTGTIRPWRMLWAEERTRESGIDHLLPVFAKNTQALQEACRKLVVEDVRRNIDWPMDEYYHIPMVHQGYILSTFRDSGSFMWGVVDDWFERKYVSADDFKKYNDSSVLLWDMRWLDRLIFTGGTWENVSIAISCSHYGKRPIANGTLTWRVLEQDGSVYAQNECTGLQLKQGELTRLCDERVYLPKRPGAAKMRLEAALAWEDGREITNSWDFWTFPSERITESAIPVRDNRSEWRLKSWMRQNYGFIKPIDEMDELAEGDLLITSEVTDILLSHLERGGRGFLATRSYFGGEITEWGASRSEYSRGTIINTEHPLGKAIPNEGFCDMPFAGMISGELDLNGTRRNDFGCAIGLRDWPRELQPIIAGIPSYKSKEPQLSAHLMEVKVGKGKLLITTLDFYSMISHPNRAATYYFDQILQYLCGNEFNPTTEVSSTFLLEQSRYSKTDLAKTGF